MNSIKPKQPRKKKCKQCLEWFQPERQMQETCGIKCAIKLAEVKREKKAAKDAANVKKKEQLATKKNNKRKREFLENDRSHQLKLTQQAFNAWIRFRDDGCACISCGRNTGAKVNAGHYLSVGSSPELRFNPLNVSLQCEYCNVYKSGNIGEYRPALVNKIGLELVEWLDGPHKPKKYTCKQLIEIRSYYAKLTRDGIKDDADRPYK